MKTALKDISPHFFSDDYHLKAIKQANKDFKVFKNIFLNILLIN